MFRSAMTLDRTARVVTGIVSAIVVVPVAIALFTGTHTFGLLGLLLGVVLGLAWAMSPKAVTVRGDELCVERRAWVPLRVPLASIASASPLGSLGSGTIRLFGVGGFFGSYGLHSNGSLGRFRLYATRRGQAVLVRRNGSELPIVLTPDDVAGTIEAIDRRPVLQA
jgi:hypothetical protein